VKVCTDPLQLAVVVYVLSLSEADAIDSFVSPRSG